MKKRETKLLFYFFILSLSPLFSQYTEVINSNKPGFSESPYSVGKGVYQFENNIFYNHLTDDTNSSKLNSLGFDLLFRTSFFLDKLELNTQISYQNDKLSYDLLPDNDSSISGLNRFTIGAKYLLFEVEYEDKSKEVRSWRKRMAFDKKRLIPSIAIYTGLNTDFLSDDYKTGGMSAKIGLLLQNNLSDNFNIITNVFYDNIGNDFEEISLILTATYNHDMRWSSFIESQTNFRDEQTDYNLGVGVAYLINRNLQLNSSARYLSENLSKGYYLGFGVSYRIDRHKDNFKLLDDEGNEINDTPINKYNKKQDGFFNRFFGIFTKKDDNTKTRKRVKKKKKN